MIPPDQALERLRAGNRRFVAQLERGASPRQRLRRDELATPQRPFATVLGCSDSRVPVEIVFDQGLGDLFVVRVAGNVVAESQIGSVEFAAEAFDTRLVVVLGHQRCGAVQATLDTLSRATAERSPNLRSIVERIGPAVEPLLAEARDRGELERRAVEANVRASCDHLRHGSRILERLIEERRLRVVGAVFSMESGAVGLLDHDGRSA